MSRPTKLTLAGTTRYIDTDRRSQVYQPIALVAFQIDSDGLPPRLAESHRFGYRREKKPIYRQLSLPVLRL